MLYRYKGIGKEGALCKGVIEASSFSDLKSQLKDSDISLITYSIDISSFFLRKVKTHVLMDLCLHLEQFENAGVSLKESLEELYQIQPKSPFKAALGEMIKDVKGGVIFSNALSKHPTIFDEVFIGLIASGEKTGKLSFAYQQIFQHLKWVDELQAQVRKSLRYPLIMSVVFCAAVFILMTILVPELVRFIQMSTATIPISTRFLVFCASVFSNYLPCLCTIFSFPILFLMIFFRCHARGDIWKHWFLDRLPWIGSLRRMICLVRFCHVFAVMFGSGIGILQALQTAQKSLKQGQIYSALENIEVLIRDGVSLSAAFHKVGIFPSLVVRMVKVGEQTSSLQTTLLHVKTHFDTMLKRKVDHLIGLLEPSMILSIGLIMAWIVYAIFLPLYDTLSVLDF
ncbi:MAG: type II secretion system F family protein [Proteobacteria bacterium]|nr:type II secretion system F family protein [Pseudomonadota bacterium]